MTRIATQKGRDNMEIPIDARLFMYICVTVGLTELLMQLSPARITKKKWGALCELAIGLLVGTLGSLTQKKPLSMALFRGLMTAAFAAAGYTYVKALIARTFGAKED